MKRISNLYDSIVDIERIQRMYDHRIRINTKNKGKLEKFENNYVSNMIYIKNILKSRSYIPGRYNIFFIKEPKLRLIMSQNIIDKIINHMVSEYFLVDVYDKTLIDTNIATRRGRGTSYGRRMLKKYLNEVKGNEFYVLKFDISKYFFNLKHDILKRLVRKKIKDKEVLKILDDIIDSTDYDYVNNTILRLKCNEISKVDCNSSDYSRLIGDIDRIPMYRKGYGLPIGNLSSQVLAIMYLDELDHFIKEELKIKYYIRYMDDGLLIHESRSYLEFCLSKIIEVLDRYELSLNDKTRIYSSNEGFEFLGFKYFIKNDKVIMKVKNQTKRKFKRKMKTLNYLVNTNKIDYKDLLHVKSSYLGHLAYGDSSKLIYNTMKQNENIYESMGNSVRVEDYL